MAFMAIIPAIGTGLAAVGGMLGTGIGALGAGLGSLGTMASSIPFIGGPLGSLLGAGGSLLGTSAIGTGAGAASGLAGMFSGGGLGALTQGMGAAYGGLDAALAGLLPNLGIAGTVGPGAGWLGSGGLGLLGQGAAGAQGAAGPGWYSSLDKLLGGSLPGGLPIGQGWMGKALGLKGAQGAAQSVEDLAGSPAGLGGQSWENVYTDPFSGAQGNDPWGNPVGRGIDPGSLPGGGNTPGWLSGFFGQGARGADGKLLPGGPGVGAFEGVKEKLGHLGGSDAAKFAKGAMELFRTIEGETPAKAAASTTSSEIAALREEIARLRNSQLQIGSGNAAQGASGAPGTQGVAGRAQSAPVVQAYTPLELPSIGAPSIIEKMLTMDPTHNA